MFSFGIRSYLFVKLFPLCYIYTLRLVVVAAAYQAAKCIPSALQSGSSHSGTVAS